VKSGLLRATRGRRWEVAEAALNLWSQRLMLLEDVFQTIQEADGRDVLR
jgi:hypothetical protein